MLCEESSCNHREKEIVFEKEDIDILDERCHMKADDAQIMAEGNSLVQGRGKRKEMEAIREQEEEPAVHG